MTAYDDAALRTLYSRLHARRPAHSAAPGIPVETVHALAAGTHEGADREALLDEVLRDPAMRAEFRFFQDVTREGPRASDFRLARWTRPLALAASVVIVVALGSRFVREAPEPLRGGEGAPSVVGPGPSVTAGPVHFVWRPVAGAETYDLEVARDDGTSLMRTTTTDTTVTAALDASADTLRWWLTVHQDDGRLVRSPVRSLLVRVP